MTRDVWRILLTKSVICTTIPNNLISINHFLAKISPIQVRNNHLDHCKEGMRSAKTPENTVFLYTALR